MRPCTASCSTPSHPPLNADSIFGTFSRSTFHTLAFAGYTCVCFPYTHLTHIRMEASFVALQIFTRRVLNEEVRVIIIKFVTCQLAFKIAGNFPSQVVYTIPTAISYRLFTCSAPLCHRCYRGKQSCTCHLLQVPNS